VTYQGCGESDTWARLDFVLYKKDHLIILSVDEFQHYDREVVCEVARMSKVVCSVRQAGDTRPILWLRFNPDYFSVDGQRVRTPLAQREVVLFDCITRSAALLEGRGEVAVYYLYYDSTTRATGLPVPEVIQQPDYASSWKELVVGCFVEKVIR
jgi:hypothetical protein